jgi:8-oxo-dGTP diphosphatase
MRVRAGIVLVEDGMVALIERYRAGQHYYVIPGGGVKKRESIKEAAIREMEEETGLLVRIKQKLARIQFDIGHQVYYLAERVSGEFGTGTGKEYTDSDPNDPNQGTYNPIWMPVAELPEHDNIYPADVAALVIRAVKDGWPSKAIKVVETQRE